MHKQRQATHKARKAKAKAKHKADFMAGGYYKSIKERNESRRRRGIAPIAIKGFR